MILLDTNYLINALKSGTPQALRLRQWIGLGERVETTALAWAEFLCGPVSDEDKRAATTLLPNPEPLLPEDAARGADLYNQTGRRRGSLADCLIAATALRLGASLASDNADDFRGFVATGLKLID
jgi:predicted nucleic acid-binding protein